ncbi:MAG: DUF504 domain-containing protein [Kiritimatiellales bacterium]|nr:DUF504 domain-containing protein [Kiritimatiellota bacterium]MBL7011685.1 DUF504 domain-containing protein [Kiritimatiellales bacterium]
MEPIRELLSRIRWDEEFGRGEFEVGIYDRVADAVFFQPLENVCVEKENHAAFTLCVDETVQTIPFHRIREVHKNGVCIWRRGASSDDS